MSGNRFKRVTKEEAEYDIALALLPFLHENGTPVYIRRDGWALRVSTSIAGPPRDRTKELECAGRGSYDICQRELSVGAEVWERAIQREDGEIFTVDLERIQCEGGVV